MKFLLGFILFFPSLLFAQSTIHGVVASRKNQMLPLTNIVLLHKNTGTITDDNGGFNLSNILPTDSIKISNIAYFSKIVAIKGIKNNDTIFLTENIRGIKGVVIRNSKNYKQEVTLGMSGYPNNGSFRLAPGNQIATYIANNQDKEGWIKGVSFKVKDFGKCNNSIRLRLLQLDTITLKPSNDLLDENILIKSSDLKKSNYIDLSNYKIFIPREGLFVVLEWIYPDKDCGMDSFTSIAANLSLPNNIVFLNFRDNAWKTSNRPRLPNGNYMTPNVALKVAY